MENYPGLIQATGKNNELLPFIPENIKCIQKEQD
jgi:hypothetical protein